MLAQDVALGSVRWPARVGNYTSVKRQSQENRNFKIRVHLETLHLASPLKKLKHWTKKPQRCLSEPASPQLFPFPLCPFSCWYSLISLLCTASFLLSKNHFRLWEVIFGAKEAKVPDVSPSSCTSPILSRFFRRIHKGLFFALFRCLVAFGQRLCSFFNISIFYTFKDSKYHWTLWTETDWLRLAGTRFTITFSRTKFFWTRLYWKNWWYF